MVIGPNDKFFLVTIPFPGHPYADPYDNPDWEIDMIAEVTMPQLRRIHRGTLVAYDRYEEEFITTSYDEALDIVLDYFPDLVVQGFVKP
jgi:hypothetical protein